MRQIAYVVLILALAALAMWALGKALFDRDED